jgi:hypothetical protein
MVAAANVDVGAQATVFNAVPVKNSLDDIGLNSNGNYSNINNYNAVFNPASNVPGTDQIGNVFNVYVSSIGNIPDWLEPLVSYLGAGLAGLAALLYDQHSINNLVSAHYLSAQTWPPGKDPLVLDLDADGLETTALNTTNPILFDHDGDGVKTATAWISADDGFLVLDRNGNGVIDNGRELFGNSTPLSAGGTAADGFAALAAQDTNLDGQVSSSDANFAALRIWQDLNQNRISEANELFTLTSKGIASITVAKTENSTLLPKPANRPSLACGPRLGPIGDERRRKNRKRAYYCDRTNERSEQGF